LNQPSFFLSSFSKIKNNKRYFNNFFSLNFWSTKESFKPHSSGPQKFLDSSTSINKPTSDLSPTHVPSPTSVQTAHPSIIVSLSSSSLSNTKRNSFILNHGGSGIPKHSEKLITTKNDGEYYSIGCGEDSFFLRHDSLGVADGVGGWRNVAPLRNAGNLFYFDHILYSISKEKEDTIK